MALATQAGYSGTPLWKKLGLKPSMKVALVDAPGHFVGLLDGAPEGVSFDAKPANADLLHLSIVDAKGLARITALARHLPPALALWVSWPKLSSPLSKGLREDDIRAAALATGLVDIKVCAVDRDWSALKLTRRRS